MTPRFIALVAAAIVIMNGSGHPARADILLATEFTGAVVNGSDPNQADNIVWTGSGLTAPSSLSLENVVANQGDGELFEGTGAYHLANGFFGGNTNISRSPSDGQWGVTIPFTVGPAGVALENIVVNLHHTGNGGTNPNTSGSARTWITLNLFDTSSPALPLETITLQDLTDTTGLGADRTFPMSSPLALAASGQYEATFLVDSPYTWGHYAVFDAVTFNGTTVVPEPSTLTLLGLGALGLMVQRRR